MGRDAGALNFTRRLRGDNVLFVVGQADFCAPSGAIDVFGDFVEDSPVFVGFTALVIAVGAYVTVVNYCVAYVRLRVGVAIRVGDFLVNATVGVACRSEDVGAIRHATGFYFLTRRGILVMA